MPDTPELVIYAVINYIPYMILALLPFESVLRFSKTKTAAVFIGASAIIVIAFVYGYRAGEKMHMLSTYLITLFTAAFYFICVKSRWGRMLFNLFMIKNVANFVVVVAKCIEGQLFPDTVGTLYHWTNSLCMLIVLIPVAPLIVYIVSHYFSKKIRDSINITIWRFLWLVPLFFYVIWLFAFYYSSTESSLELALKPSSSIFMIVFLAGQLLIYICIARLVINFNEKVLLEEENHRLLDQQLQFQSIKEHIQEISRIKHDLRHHLVVISNYADSGEYDKLKEYLKEYICTIPSKKISYCGNNALNMLLVYYSQRCRDESILFNVDMKIPANIGISDSDTTVLFGNLIENAVEACEEIAGQDNREVSITGKVFQSKLIFVVENSYNNAYIIDKTGFIRSTKHEGLGIGTASVKDIVEKHSGTISVSTNGDKFSVSIIMPAYQ